MKLRRFFTPHNNLRVGIKLTLDRDESKHLVKTLRLQTGSKLEITNPQGQVMLAEVHTASSNAARITLLEQLVSPHLAAPNLILLLGLAKAPAFAESLTAATELGAELIVPISSSFQQISPDLIQHKQERWQNLLVSALKQSQADRLPEMLPTVTINELKDWELQPQIIVLDSKQNKLTTSLDQIKITAGPVAIAIGPEAGWSGDDIALWQKLGAQFVHLQTPIMRTPTAVTVGLTIAKSLQGEL